MGLPKPSWSSHCGVLEPRPLASTTSSASSRFSVPRRSINLHATYAAGRVKRVTGHVALVEHADAAKRCDALANLPFEEAAALAEEVHSTLKASLPVAEVEPAQIATHVDKMGSALDELRQQLGKVVRDDAFALLQKHVHVPHLGEAFAELGPVGEAVAFDERYRAEMFGQGASRKQPCDASTDDDRSPALKAAARGLAISD